VIVDRLHRLLQGRADNLEGCLVGCCAVKIVRSLGRAQNKHWSHELHLPKTVHRVKLQKPSWPLAKDQ
jgi:hypothetical protein